LVLAIFSIGLFLSAVGAYVFAPEIVLGAGGVTAQGTPFQELQEQIDDLKQRQDDFDLIELLVDDEGGKVGYVIRGGFAVAPQGEIIPASMTRPHSLVVDKNGTRSVELLVICKQDADCDDPVLDVRGKVRVLDVVAEGGEPLLRVSGIPVGPDPTKDNLPPALVAEVLGGSGRAAELVGDFNVVGHSYFAADNLTEPVATIGTAAQWADVPDQPAALMVIGPTELNAHPAFPKALTTTGEVDMQQLDADSFTAMDLDALNGRIINFTEGPIGKEDPTPF